MLCDVTYRYGHLRELYECEYETGGPRKLDFVILKGTRLDLFFDVSITHWHHLSN